MAARSLSEPKEETAPGLLFRRSERIRTDWLARTSPSRSFVLIPFFRRRPSGSPASDAVQQTGFSRSCGSRSRGWCINASAIRQRLRTWLWQKGRRSQTKHATLDRLHDVEGLLTFSMGKNTSDRQAFIIGNLRAEKDLIEA